MKAGIDSGCVRLQVAIDGERVSRVSVASERPAVGQALRGRAADEAVRLVPLLFALCGHAQGRAAALALAAARGSLWEAQLDPAVQREALREHLMRWLIDLPPLLGEVPLREDFVAAANWLAKDRRDALAALLDKPRIRLLRRRLNEMDDVTGPPSRLLPFLDAKASLSLWPQLDAGFCRTPEWQGGAAETGAFARRATGNEVMAPAFSARWLARMDELFDWAAGKAEVGAGGTASAAAGGAARGRALVETARGLLMHEIVLDGERIADYFIVAPTEWNFHPQGPLLDWLAGRAATDRTVLSAFTARAVAALDPCVRWELEWL